MAQAVVAFVLQSFRDLIVEEAKLLGGVRGQIDALEDEFERMMSFLKDADARQQEGDGINTRIKQVRNLAYRAQDVIEKYAIHMKSEKRSGIKKLLKKFDCISIHNVATEIEVIKYEIIKLREGLQTYGISPISEGERTKAAKEKERVLRQTFAFVEDADFVGMEDDINTLVSLVVDERKNKIISVYGMGGSGKTTMARQIFNHPQVQQVFGASAWVCITQSCETITVLQGILEQLTGRSMQSTIFDSLVRDIAKVVVEKKCFVVLDDIWNIDDWKVLSRAFADARSLSKILITTRKYKVASVGSLHHQRLLNEEEGLQLLKNKIFTAQNEHKDSRLEKLFGDLGKEMISKCGGLPLAIAAIGGILRGKFYEKEWKDIHNDIGSNLSHGLDGLDDSETTNKVLALSYRDLPHFLKPCFLYMSVYREDEVIPPRKLYHLWIAEGMVSSGYLLANETLMDVAERFLQELNLRCMVQLQMDRIEGKVTTCKLHDLMRDLCLEKAKEEEFLERVETDFQGGQSNRIDTSSVGDHSRRVAIEMNIDKNYSECVVFDQVTRHEFVRTFSVLEKRSSYEVKFSVEASQAVTKFKLLRVLDFENIRFPRRELPNGIGELILLRFLSLRGCEVKELPSSVGDLPLLQTLDLRASHAVRIPYDIFAKESQLRHLYLRDFSTTGPSTEKLKLEGLSKLESFYIGNKICELDLTGLSRLVNMRCFEYFNCDTTINDWPLIMDQIKSWNKVHLLHIRMKQGEEDYINKVFTSHNNITHMTLGNSKLNASPTYQQMSCQNLVSLEIKFTDLVDGLLEFVGKLPKLRSLCVKPTTNFEEISFTNDMGFPQLQLLQLHFKKLTLSLGCLPNLITLKLDHCKEIVPEDGLKYLHNLQELWLPNYSSELKRKCLRNHPHYAHIFKDVDYMAFVTPEHIL